MSQGILKSDDPISIDAYYREAIKGIFARGTFKKGEQARSLPLNPEGNRMQRRALAALERKSKKRGTT